MTPEEAAASRQVANTPRVLELAEELFPPGVDDTTDYLFAMVIQPIEIGLQGCPEAPCNLWALRVDEREDAAIAYGIKQALGSLANRDLQVNEFSYVIPAHTGAAQETTT